VNMLPSGWRTITLLNPVVLSDLRLPLELLPNRRRQRRVSFGMTIGFCWSAWSSWRGSFRTGYRLKKLKIRGPDGAQRESGTV